MASVSSGCNKESHLYNVFFTGGLDSTYRLCQLALDKNAIVQPIYILFPDNKKSPHVRFEIQKEIEAQDKILDYIVHRPNTKAKFMPIQRIEGHSLVFPGMGKWEQLLSKAKLGWQYVYCAQFSHTHKGVELCQEVFPKGYADRNIFEFDKDDFGRVIVKPNKNNPKWLQDYASFIWGDMSYPIYGVSRREMKENLKKWGYDGIWKQVWFCYKSINNKPCGVCDNCVKKLNEGLVELFDRDAIRRFYILWILTSMFGLEMKMLYHESVYYGEDKFISFLINKSISNEIKPSNCHVVVKRVLSMKFSELKHLYEEYSNKSSHEKRLREAR